MTDSGSAHTERLNNDAERLKLVLSAVETGIIEITENDDIVYGNTHAESLICRKLNTPIHIPFSSLLADTESQDLWVEVSSQYFQSTLTESVKRKVNLNHPDGSVIPCEINIRKEFNSNNTSVVLIINELDELTRTRQRLERLNKQFKIASESAHIGIWNHDFHLNYTEWDSQMFELYGTTEEAYDGTTQFWEKRVHPDDLERVRKELSDCLYNNEKLNTQFRIHLPDGTQRTLKAYGYCQLDEFGQPDSVIGVNYDITEQLSLAQRAENESRLKQAILDGANYSIISTDADGNIVTFNHGAQNLLGLSEREHAQIKSPTDYHLSHEIEARRKKLMLEYPEVAFSDFDVLTYKSALGTPDEREWTYVRTNGSTISIMLSVTALRDAENTITGFVFIGRSLDEVKKYERESKRIKKLLETTERIAQLGGWEYNIIDMTFHCSNGLHRIFGTQENSQLSLSEIIEMFPPDVRRIIRQAVMRAIDQGVPWDLKLPYHHSEDADIWLRSHGHAEFKDGRAILLKGAFQDISPMKRAEEKAKTASLAKSEFLANMSHELRTPINGIIGMTQLLMRSQLDEHQAHYAQLTKMSADALLTLVNDILDFSKVEAGKLDIEKIDVHITELMAVIRESFAFKAEEKNIELNLTIDSSVPEVITSDPTRLRQVLNNLLSNSLKFTETGEINVSVTRIDDTLMFSVEDSGIGIPADKVDQLFDKFTQLDNSTTRQYGGSGLGLAISKQLAQLMGGEIGVTSVKGKGSMFWFTIELNVPAQPSPPIPFQPKDDNVIAANDSAIKTLEILLVEDNYINQQVCIEFLVSLGHSVTLASDGNQALDRLRTAKTFDVILMDCQMPVLDGYETTRIIRRDNSGQLDPTIPIVALTANAMEDDKEKCIQSGMNYYLAKPFNIDELSAILNQLSQNQLASGTV